MSSSKENPRRHNSNFRRKVRNRFKAMDAPCGICKGRFGPIRYDQKSCPENPLSLCIDEIIPVSKWKQYGYASPYAVCMDMNNLQASHYCCNAAKSDKVSAVITRRINTSPVVSRQF